MTTSEFIQKAKKVHKERYDYSETKYKNAKTKVVIVCNKHGRFKQLPYNHLKGQNCPICGRIELSNKLRRTNEQFIKKAQIKHKNRYDYSKTKYIKDNKEVIIICKEHGEFRQRAGVHLNGSGCSECGKKCRIEKKLKTIEQFIKGAIKIHKNTYDYSKVEYIHARKKVVIICKKHGGFEQTPNCHLNGAGCPHCQLKNEGKVKNLLSKYFKDWEIISNKKIWNTYKDYNHRRYCDFWLEKNGIKIIVEYDGELHFEPVSWWVKNKKQAQKNLKNYQLKDKLDAEFCKENNIILHRIKYDEDKKKSIKELLKRVG